MYDYNRTKKASKTLARRINDLYEEFKLETLKALERMEPSAFVELSWASRGKGFMWLDVSMTAADGKKLNFQILPEEPESVAGEILYKHGGY